MRCSLVQRPWAWVSDSVGLNLCLATSSWLTLDELFTLSEAQFSHLSNVCCEIHLLVVVRAALNKVYPVSNIVFGTLYAFNK